MRGLALAAFAAFVVAVPGRTAFGQDQSSLEAIGDKLALSGSLRGAYWTSNRVLDDQENFTPVSLWLKSTPDLGGGFGARFEGWVNAQNLPYAPATHAELRDGFFAWEGNGLQLSVGRRLVRWGRADQVNPTNVIASRDYTLLFSDDDDEYRGNLMTTAAYGVGGYTMTAFWIPEFRPTVYPIFVPSNVTLTRESGRIDVAQGAVRIDHVGEGFDWSASYFDGVDRDPDFRITGIALTGVTINEPHHRFRSVGADFATNVGDYGLRGEVAYGMPYESDDADVFNRHSFIEAVIGGDRTFNEHLSVNLQYVFHYVTNFQDPHNLADPNARAIAIQGALVSNQLTRMQHGLTLRIGYSALNDLLSLELAGAGFATDESGVLRPKVSYAITDTLKVIAGADFFFGGTDSYFGQVRRNRTAYVELRRGF